MELLGKTVLVTGGGKRVGRAIALAAARRGASVAVHYHQSAEDARATAAECRLLGGRSVEVQASLADPGEVQRMVATAAAALGGLDAVVNNASVFYRTPVEQVRDEDWQQMLGTNLLAPWWVIQAALPHFHQAGGGKVVNIADWAALRPYSGYLPYVVSKGALITMTKALAKELAPAVTVNAVLPGPMLPPPDMEPAQAERIAARVPLGRWGSPEDVAAAVMFFLAETNYATGSLLAVDGGSLL